MQLISPELATKIMAALEAGASNTTQTLTDVLNEFINYLIFVEILNVSRFLLAIVALLVIKKAVGLFVLGATEETAKNQIRGGGVLVSMLVLGLSLMWSWQSFMSLGKVLLAPKVYVIEMAIQKVQEIKGVAK